jgi:hypothetical protein
MEQNKTGWCYLHKFFLKTPKKFQLDRIKEVEEQHQREFEAERERRMKEIRELREEHQVSFKFEKYHVLCDNF